jgi:urease accessory protein
MNDRALNSERSTQRHDLEPFAALEDKLSEGSKLLATLQLADSFFPSGLYTQSHGLEQFIAAGASGAAQLEPIIHDYLRHAAGPADVLAARWVVRAALAHDLDLVAAIDARLEAGKLSVEGRTASKRCGGRVLLLGRDLFERELLQEYAVRVETGQAHGHQSVVLALLGAAAGLDETTVVLVELHTFAVSLISAAVRLAALDHTAGQKLLLRALPVIAEAAEVQRDLDWRDIGGFAPQIDVMQFRHRYAEMHMFVS